MKTRVRAQTSNLFASSMALASMLACAGGGDATAPGSNEPGQEPGRDVPVTSDPSRTDESRAGESPLEVEAVAARRASSNAARVTLPLGSFECEDTCASKRAECGLVCDEECGECSTGEACDNNKCVCQSSCDGSRCVDSCGRPCACPFGAACDARGFCVPADTCGDGPCSAGVEPPITPILPPLPPPPDL
jgi:hypothetical protein